MLRRSLVCIVFLLAIIPLSASALSEPAVVPLEGADTVAEGVEQIQTYLELSGLDIVLTLDHSANAASVGLELAPTTVIFARLPRSPEKLLLRKGDTVAIDLPIKFLVFEQDNEILLATNSVGYLIDRHSLSTKDKLLDRIDKVQEFFGTPDDGLNTLQSTRSVTETVLAIQDALMLNGSFGIPLVLDFGRSQSSVNPGNSSGNSGNTAPVLIVFGNPEVGTPLMEEQRSIGIDLPQKYLIWRSDSGNVNITYNDPFALADRHSIVNQDARLTAIAGALNNFARAGAGLD